MVTTPQTAAAFAAGDGQHARSDAPLARSRARAARLSHWGVIRASGADASTFLQSQLTNDVESLDAASVRLAGYCSPKGRLLASFWVWRPQPEEFLLACSADVLPPALKRLSMFVLRAKCRLADASEVRLWGITGDAGTPAAGPRPTGLVRLPDAGGTPRWLWAATDDEAPAIEPLPVEAWDRLEVESGIARIVGATVERFVPQMLNYEIVGGVDFRKGCYPGQEVVARTQYRGSTKRRTLRFDIDPGASMRAAPGDEVFVESDAAQPAGMVANAAAREDGGQVLLVEVKLDARDGSLRLKQPDGPELRPAALPYRVPIDES